MTPKETYTLDEELIEKMRKFSYKYNIAKSKIARIALKEFFSRVEKGEVWLIL